MKILACFYIFASILDLLQQKFALHALDEGDLLCVSNKYVVVVNMKGAFFMLFVSFVDFLYTFVIIITFYEVPKRVYGLFRRNSNK